MDTQGKLRLPMERTSCCPSLRKSKRDRRHQSQSQRKRKQRREKPLMKNGMSFTESMRRKDKRGDKFPEFDDVPLKRPPESAFPQM